MVGDFTVRGRDVPEPTDRDGFAELYGDEVGYVMRGEVAVAGVSRGDATPVELAGADDDVVEVEDADGVVTFHRARTLVEDAGGSARGHDGIDLTTFLAGTTRGDGAQLAAVRRVGVTLPAAVAEAVRELDAAVGAEIARSGVLRDGFGMIADRLPRVLLDPAAKAAVTKLVDWFDAPVPDGAPAAERRRKPKARGVYEIGPELLLEPAGRLVAAPQVSRDPYLVLLHGTFSHTEAAFAQLRGTPEWTRAVGRYPGRALAVEHATLGRTPAENALEAAAFLPDGARLHLVSHSRGGLVGEALSYAARHDPDLRAYADAPEHPDVTALPELRRVLVDRGITVERFVRVACPARGTTLASRRLDRWASFLFNVFNLVPVMRETGIAALVKKFLLTLLDQRTDPRVVPGLEAQMPEAPFLRMLLAGQPLDDGLGSIAGDVEGSGIARRLLVLGADLFYREDHDLVVPTSSMSGGVDRAAARRAHFQGGEVNHATYFANQDSRRAMEAWLGASAGADVPGFGTPPAPPRPADRGAAPVVAGDVLLVPDVFGSELTVGHRPGWPDVTQLVRLGPALALGGGAGGTGGLVAAYAPLVAALAAGHRVTGQPWDPRRTLADAAAQLATVVRARLTAGGSPHLVTHGAGALVALAALATDGLLADWRAAGGRAVLLGPPLEGSWLVAARLAGRDELTAALALLDRAATPAVVAQWLGGWPALADLHPDDPDAASRRLALRPGSWTAITAVYGSADRTVCGVTGDGAFLTSSEGDGFAVHPSGRLRGPEAWFALVPHADLPADPEVAAAVLDLLAGRVPVRLLTSPPARPAGGDLLPDPRGELLLPTSPEIVRTAWGGGTSGARRPVLRVGVVHGHLRCAAGPVLVGHQDGTPISGAEKALDTYLLGALDRRLALGQYPGPLGSCEVFSADTGPAAVVVGLGDAGNLSSSALTASITQAVLQLAALQMDRAEPGSPPQPLVVSSVLMGTSLVPAMPVENSLTAIVSGVRQANRRLRDLAASVLVEELRIVELYEERAIQATRTAVRLAQTLHGDGSEEIAVERRLLDGCGGMAGLPRPDYQEGVWRTIRIVAADTGERPGADGRLAELSFTSIGRSARAEQRVNSGQRRLLDALVAEAIESPHPDVQLFNTLYELLVPNTLKGQGYGSENLMLVVDETAGVLPLEMLASRSDDRGVQPLAVEVGMVRRLETRSFAEVPRPSSGHAALVIGDPAGTGMARLPGARAEAHLVHRLLEREGYEVTAIIPGDDATEDVVTILNALFRREYRIVHIAGHGHFSPDPSRSGVVIGHDAFLGALEIAKMRTTPDLVFLNCCHLGAMAPRPGGGPGGTVEPALRADRLASSISRQLIENGVRAVVAAGWAVDDRAAHDFATALYGGLLVGADLGAATLDARKRVHGSHRTTNTWGAYQVYGEPAFRLDPGRRSRRHEERPVARREFADALAEVKGRAADVPDAGAAAIASGLSQLLADVPAAWLGGPERSVVGDVWALLARYREAVECYEAVQHDWGATGSFKTVEQLVNARAKWAVERTLHPDEPGPDPTELLALAEESVVLLLAMGETPERLSLLGSVARRRAQCLPLRRRAALTAALVAARDAYRRAVDLHRERDNGIDFYPALNEVVLGWLASKRDHGELFEEARAKDLITASRTAASAARCPDFWSRVTPADADLAEALVDEALPGRVAEIEVRYAAAFAESSRRDRVAVLEHLDIVERALPSRSTDADAVAVRSLRAQLAVWEPGV